MRDVICGAIAKKKIISFHYDGRLRRVEPHLLGYDIDGDLKLSAWQLSGGSGVGFRDFHVAELSGLTISSDSFAGARRGYNQNDSTMKNIVCRL